MEEIKKKKHRVYKHLTIMFVPYTSKKVFSIKIPHWIFHVLLSVAVVLILSLTYSIIQTRSLNQINSVYQTELTEFNQKTNALTQQAEVDKETILMQKEQYDTLLNDYESHLSLFQQKTAELENSIAELSIIRQELDSKISDASKKLDISTEIPETSVGGGEFDSLEANDSLEDVDNMFSKFELLRSRITSEIENYSKLGTGVENLQPFLNAFPSAWPVSGRITQEMGYRVNPFTNKGTEYHSGMDIAVPTGTPVNATGDGIVVFSDYNGGYGYLVKIDHGYGLQTYYGHNSKLLVNVGDTVKRGDVIAKSGSTGRSTGPHVHYEVRLNGAEQNPRDYYEEDMP